MKVRIATYNIRKGGRRRRHHLADVVQALDADVTVLQEATDPKVVRYVADAAGAEVVIHAPGRSVALLSRIPTRAGPLAPDGAGAQLRRGRAGRGRDPRSSAST